MPAFDTYEAYKNANSNQINLSISLFGLPDDSQIKQVFETWQQKYGLPQAATMMNNLLTNPPARDFQQAASLVENPSPLPNQPNGNSQSGASGWFKKKWNDFKKGVNDFGVGLSGTQAVSDEEAYQQQLKNEATADAKQTDNYLQQYTKDSNTRRQIEQQNARIAQENEDEKFFWNSSNNMTYASLLVQANGDIKSLPPAAQKWIKDYEERHKRFFGNTGDKYTKLKDTRDNVQMLYGKFGYNKMAGLEPEKRGEEFMNLAKQLYSNQITKLAEQYLTAGTGKSLDEIHNAYSSIDTGKEGAHNVLMMLDASGQKQPVTFTQVEKKIKDGCEGYYRLVAFENYLEEHMSSGTIDSFMKQEGMEGEYDYVANLLNKEIPQSKQNYMNRLNYLRAQYLPQIQETMQSLYSDASPVMPDIQQYYSGMRRAKGNWRDKDYGGYAAKAKEQN